MQAGYGWEFFRCGCGGWEDCGTGADADVEDLFCLVLVEFVGCYGCMDLICCPVRFSIGDSIGKRDIKWD